VCVCVLVWNVYYCWVLALQRLRREEGVRSKRARKAFDGRKYSFPSAPSVAKPSQARRSIARDARSDRRPRGRRSDTRRDTTCARYLRPDGDGDQVKGSLFVRMCRPHGQSSPRTYTSSRRYLTPPPAISISLVDELRTLSQAGRRHWRLDGSLTKGRAVGGGAAVPHHAWRRGSSCHVSGHGAWKCHIILSSSHHTWHGTGISPRHGNRRVQKY